MHGDFSRINASERFTRVLKQQGRCELDSDWNELVDALTSLRRSALTDTLGPCAVPAAAPGFGLSIAGGGAELHVGAGRIYVQGSVCTNPAGVALNAQPMFPGYLPPAANGVYAAVLEVWDRHLTSIEAPEILEEALLGVDTTTRTETIGQVRLVRIGDSGPLSNFDCSLPIDPPSGTLAARAEPDALAEDPCIVPANAGYRGIDNRLYRVQIVAPDRFVWSRDNGAVALPITAINGDEVTVGRLGRDSTLTVNPGDWVEVVGDQSELLNQVGTLAQVLPGGVDSTTRRIQLSASVASHAGETHLRLRRWDHSATAAVPLANGAIPLQADWYELEDGVQVRFDTAGDYRVGDWWTLPARTQIGDIAWPVDGLGDPLFVSPHGIVRQACVVGLALREAGNWTEVRDCRRIFHPLPERTDTCCTITLRPGDDIQAAVDSIPNGADALICLCAGEWELVDPVEIRDKGRIVMHGVGPMTKISTIHRECALWFERCTGVEVHDLCVRSGRAAHPPAGIVHARGALTCLDCTEVRVERVMARCSGGVLRGAACIAIRNLAELTQQLRENPGDGQLIARLDSEADIVENTTRAAVRDCRLDVGDGQTALLIVDVGRVDVADNRIAIVPGSRESSRSSNDPRRDSDFASLVGRNVLANGSPEPPGSTRPWVTVPMGQRFVHFLIFPELGVGSSFPNWRTLLMSSQPGDTSERALELHAKAVFGQLARGGEDFSQDIRVLFRPLIDAIRAGDSPYAAQGVVVAGRVTREARVRDNTIRGVAQGVHIAYSHRDQPPEFNRSSALRSAHVTGNCIELWVPLAVNMDTHGILVFGAADGTVADNTIDVNSAGHRPDNRIDGIVVAGRLERRFNVRSNTMSGVDEGVQLIPLILDLAGYQARRGPLIRVVGNIAVGPTLAVRGHAAVLSGAFLHENIREG